MELGLINIGIAVGATAAGRARSVREVVRRIFIKVAAAQDRALQPLADDLPLIDSGVDSLCIAVIVAELERELGFDPFLDLDESRFPADFGDFVRLYESAAASR